MLKIFATDRDGIERAVPATEGISLMENLKEAGIEGIVALCGGCCACATCHVYVDASFAARLPEQDEEEAEMLSNAGFRQDNSRLACQVEFSAELDGLKVTVAPE